MELRRSPLIDAVVRRDSWRLIGFLVSAVGVSLPGTVVLLPLALVGYALLVIAVDVRVAWGPVAAVVLLLVVTLLPLLHAARALASFDRRLSRKLLQLDLGPEIDVGQSSPRHAGPGSAPAPTRVRRVLRPLWEQRTWRDLLWVALRCVTSLVLGAAGMVLLELLRLVGRSLWSREWWWAAPTLLVVALLLVAVVHLLRAAGWVAAALAQALLAPSVDERVLALRRRADTLHERVELARELHDSLGHSVSLMVLQAAAARSRLGDRTPAPVLQACADIERTGRDAMQELHRVLRLLRDRDSHPFGRGGSGDAPGLEQLDEVVDALRRAGLPVELEVDADADAVRPALSAALLRVVQESLTNVVVHAGLPVTSVRVRRDADRTVVVVDNQAGHGGWGAAGSGTGLVELQARLRALGAELEAGPRAGGFRVTATAPLWVPA